MKDCGLGPSLAQKHHECMTGTYAILDWLARPCGNARWFSYAPFFYFAIPIRASTASMIFVLNSAGKLLGQGRHFHYSRSIFCDPKTFEICHGIVKNTRWAKIFGISVPGFDRNVSETPSETRGFNSRLVYFLLGTFSIF